jgi:hypothetical protein
LWKKVANSGSAPLFAHKKHGFRLKARKAETHSNCYIHQWLSSSLYYVGLTRVARWPIFKQKKFNLGKFERVLYWKMLIHFMAIWSILRPFSKFCAFYYHLVYFSRFGMLYQEKSGNPVCSPTGISVPCWIAT